MRCRGFILTPTYRVRDGRPVGLLPLVFQKSLVGRFLTSVPYLNYAGILSQDQEARSELAHAAGDLADRLQAQRLELRGRDGGDLPLPAWEGKSGYTLDLYVLLQVHPCSYLYYTVLLLLLLLLLHKEEQQTIPKGH